jgi:hypothetical protein
VEVGNGDPSRERGVVGVFGLTSCVRTAGRGYDRD